ncbi:MAG: hypothetical protein DDG59_05015 [Anaerolineae bacterium]|nr:MAG: hypothetical protein DDG59_05015 [Anaerolineae bacterium]
MVDPLSFDKEVAADRWRLYFWRLACALSAVLALRVGWYLIREALERGILSASLRYQVAIATAIFVFLLSGILLLVSYWKPKKGVFRAIQGFERYGSRWGRRNLGLLLFSTFILTFALNELSAGILQPYWSRLSGLVLIALFGLPWVQGSFRLRHSLLAFVISLLISMVSLQILSLLSKVSTYPFTLEWSEASRYYYASLFVGERVYGVKTAWTVLHPSRYLLQAIPFMVTNLPLWFHRLWQVGLWIGISSLTAYAFLRRYGKALSPSWRWIGLGWLFLYLLLGPVYYHLQLAVLPLLFWFQPTARSTREKIVSFLVLILTSIWAGLSRLNWYPMPALVAALLYILEMPYRTPFWRYYWRPVVWTIAAVGVALTAHWGYVQLSGNPPSWFGTSLTSQLLWYRLFPNPTFPLGILLASWIVIFPMSLLLFFQIAQGYTAVHPMRWLSLLAILIGLYGGGLVVSVKIGGGSNLHNLDAFWISFGVVFVALMTDTITLDTPLPQIPALLSGGLEIFWEKTWIRVALIGTLIVPGFFLLSSLEPSFRPDWAATEKALRRLQGLIKDIPTDQEVLFISERQLLTFGYLRGVRLVPEYERVFLMEMAMANNQSYLQQFYRDLRTHRFALIVNEPLYTTTKGSPVRFGEENDAWVERVAKPLLCYYKPVQQARMLLMGVEIQILEPRAKPTEGCP